MVDEIENLPDLLKDFLGPHKAIQKTDITRLTAPGDNYGSVMLKLDITLKNNKTNKEEQMYAVGKKIPESIEYQEIFNIQVTFKNEVAFYEEIVPTLREFQKEMGVTKLIDCFADFYCARFNMDSTGNKKTVDQHAILIFENIVSSGFSNIDRIKGFDLQTCQLVLKDLAELHAVALALKLKKPQVFEEKVKRFCHKYEFDGSSQFKLFDGLRAILAENEKCTGILPKLKFLGEVDLLPVREPFATLIHNDTWTNNTMQKFENGKAVANKFVDFQIFNYGSPAKDLFFFLWSSVPQEILEKHLDDLIAYYHQQFVKFLEELECDTEPFCLQKLLEEISIEAAYEYGHALFFSTFIVHRDKDLKETENFDDQLSKMIESVSLEATKKAWFMTEECERRGWLSWAK